MRQPQLLNLQEYTITAGHAVFVTPGTIVEPLDVSDDFLLIGMGVPNDLFERFIQLVNRHCHEQRGLSFYADKHVSRSVISVP